MTNVLSWGFDFGQVSGEAEIVAAELQDLFHGNWELFSPGEITGAMRVEGQREFESLLDSLRTLGYVVFAGRRKRLFDDGSSWTEALISVQPADEAVAWEAVVEI
jgi:hypothetical protein